jgi:hypothetical protein
MRKVWARTTRSAFLVAGTGPMGRIKNGFMVCNAQITTRIRLGSLTTNHCFAAAPPTLSKLGLRSNRAAADTPKMSGTHG